MSVFSCDICKREFTEKYKLTRHVKNQHGWSCHRCNQSFNRRDNYEMHQLVCLFKTTGKRSGGRLDTTAKKLKDNTNRVGGALNGTVNEYRLNLEVVLKESTFQEENRINEEVVKKRAVQFYLSLRVNFYLTTDVTLLTDPPAVLSTDTIEVYDSSDVHDAVNSAYDNLASAIEDFQQRRSGWILDKLVALDLHLLEFEPLRATSYIPRIQNREAVINIQNKDEKFFLWSVTASLYGDSHQSHHPINHLEYEKEFKLRGISFPMALKNISKFEILNNVSISVYGYQEGKVGDQLIYFSLLLMIRTTIVSSWTLVDW